MRAHAARTSRADAHAENFFSGPTHLRARDEATARVRSLSSRTCFKMRTFCSDFFRTNAARGDKREVRARASLLRSIFFATQAQRSRIHAIFLTLACSPAPRSKCSTPKWDALEPRERLPARLRCALRRGSVTRTYDSNVGICEGPIQSVRQRMSPLCAARAFAEKIATCYTIGTFSSRSRVSNFRACSASTSCLSRAELV